MNKLFIWGFLVLRGGEIPSFLIFKLFPMIFISKVTSVIQLITTEEDAQDFTIKLNRTLKYISDEGHAITDIKYASVPEISNNLIKGTIFTAFIHHT